LSEVGNQLFVLEDRKVQEGFGTIARDVVVGDNQFVFPVCQPAGTIHNAVVILGYNHQAG
jgi:hypothetical protein